MTFKRYPYHGEPLTLSEIAERKGVCVETLRKAIRRLGIAQALDQPTPSLATVRRRIVETQKLNDHPWRRVRVTKANTLIKALAAKALAAKVQ